MVGERPGAGRVFEASYRADVPVENAVQGRALKDGAARIEVVALDALLVLLFALRHIGGGQEEAVVDRAFGRFFHDGLGRDVNGIRRNLVLRRVEQGVGRLIDPDQGEACAKDAERDLVEAQITHGLALLQSLADAWTGSIRARAREAFLHFSAGAATGDGPAK